MKLISFHSGRSPAFIIKSSTVPNKSQCEWPWVCSAAMLLQRHSTHEEIRESVRLDYWVGSHNPARMPGSIFELWISDGFEWFFAVTFVYPKFAVLARSKQLMPVTVKFRLDFLVCGLQGHLLQHLARVGPMFPCNKGHEAMKNCRDWDFSLRGLEVLPPAFLLPMFAKCDALPKGDLFSMMDMFV